MLWRSAYQTLVARDVELPALIDNEQLGDSRVILGGFHFQAQREMAIWRKLIVSDAPDCSWIQAYFLPEPAESDFKLLASLVPSSELVKTRIIKDHDLAWRRLIAPGSVDESFAVILGEGRVQLIMKGLPTEDAWAAFLAEIPR